VNDRTSVVVVGDAALREAFHGGTMMMEVVGDYEYRRSDIIGHGAFAVVFRGSSRLVGISAFVHCKIMCVVFRAGHTTASS